MHKEETSNSWIEPVLARHLGPAAAPAGLWERVAEPRMPRPALANLRLVSSFAAVLLGAVLLWGFYRSGNPALEFRSAQPDQIQAWVKANTGLDVPLHAPGSVRLVGASAIRGSEPAAKIIYRVGPQNVSLMIASAGAPAAAVATSSGSVFSWTARGQRYTLVGADAEDLRIGCLRCHAGA